MLSIKKSLILFAILYACFYFSDEYNQPESFSDGYNRITQEYRRWSGRS